jgi:hypothetical protein
VNIGIVCNNVGPSQLAYYLIKTGNEFVKTGDDDLVVFFYELMPECIKPNFALMNLSEAYDYNGVLVATDINSASRILEYPGTQEKFFYLWDLDWIKLPQKQYENLLQVYKNPRLPLIVRSKRHFELVKNLWQEPVGIVEDCNIGQLKQVIENSKNVEA